MDKTLVVLLPLVLLVACAPQHDAQNTILVTFYLLLDITQEIAGPEASVTTLIPPGVELHQYEPTASDMVRLGQARMFVRIGLEWGPLEERFLDALSAKPAVILASKGVDLVHADDGHEETGADHEEQTPAGEETHGHSRTVDPHIWLSPRPMKIVARNIAEGFQQADPANAARYDANLQRVLAKLDALDTEYATGLASCKVRTIIVSHLAFGYPGRDYGFSQHGIHGLSPESEPSPQVLKNLIDAARHDGIKHVLYEQLIDPRVSETIAKEAGADTLVISHIDVQRPGEEYFSQMRGNLRTLRTALQCD